jgi:hypothetical protein
MYCYYHDPVGANEPRWMFSNQIGSKYGQFSDQTKGSGPYDVTWENNTRYYHTLVTSDCEDTDIYWNNIGQCIKGERANVKSGDSVAISKDGTIVAFGAEKNSDKVTLGGQVRVFRWNSSEWEQMGSDIEHDINASKFGHSISLNEDGSILAIGAYNDTKNPIVDANTDQNIGSVRVYKWQNTEDDWNLHGNIMYGKNKGDNFGSSCQLNNSGDLLVVGSQMARESSLSEEENSSTNYSIPTGSVSVYKLVENAEWLQVGQTIYGEENSGFGSHVCITSISEKEGEIIIAGVGDKICDIFRYEHSAELFLNKGQRITLQSNTKTTDTYDKSNAPSSISMNQYGDRIAVSIPNIEPENYIEYEEFTVGQVYTYEYDGVGNWNQLGQPLDGEATSLKLSDTGSTLIYSSINQVIENSFIVGEYVAPGAVFSYEFIGDNWEKLGTELYGKTHEDKFGYALDFTITSGKIILVSTSPNHTIYSDETEDYRGLICVYESPPDFQEEMPTPKDCVFTQTEWTSCSQVCDATGTGPGTQTKTTTIISEPVNGGQVCPGTTIIQTCGEDRCPIDCQVSDWNWSGSCSKDCDGGIEVATRDIIVNNQFGGTPCPALETSRPCNTFVCPEDCEGKYEEFSPCTVSCGGGTRQLAFNVTKSEIGTGLCPERGKIIEEECNIQPCPFDCVGSWSEWTTCTASCGGGKQTRSFVISESEKYGGVCLNRNKIETRDCNTQACPSDCEGYYTSWSSCNASCGGGTQTKSFIITKAEQNGGTCANRGKILSQECNTSPCPQNCIGSWSDYGPCSKDCGGGTQTRNFVVSKNELFGGVCPNKGGVQSRSCNSQPCPRDCSGYWSSWSSCSRTCGGGTQTRNFIVRTSEAYGGICPDKGKQETQSCNTNPCPTNCEGYWTSWSACSKNCGGGNQSRTYVVTKSEANGGTCSNRNKTETRTCNSQCCKQDCEGYWTDWGYNNVVGKCSECGNGKQTRKWVTTKPQSCGGKCDHYNGKTETRNATESECGCCPEPCKYGYDIKCLREDDKIQPPDNLVYQSKVRIVAEPAKCGGKCFELDPTNIQYDWCDEKGPNLPAYKMTGFGGENGEELDDLIFYPVYRYSQNRTQHQIRVGPQGKSWETEYSHPPQGYYDHLCLDKYSSTTNYNITPCDGKRKYIYMTKRFFRKGDKIGLYTPMWRYYLAWGPSAGMKCSYSFVPIGSNGNFCPYTRDYLIRNDDGTYRSSAYPYGWILIKQLYSVRLRSTTRAKWTLSQMLAWSHYPNVTGSNKVDPSEIDGYYTPYPEDGATFKYCDWKWGTNMSSSHNKKYDATPADAGFQNKFGKIKKVKTIDWGDGHLRTSTNDWKYKED